MSGRMYYLIDSEDPKSTLSKFRKKFGIPDVGKITQDNKIIIRADSNNFSDHISEGILKEDSIWAEVSEKIDNVVNISWQDTSHITYANLYKIRDGEIVRIDHEYGDLHPFFKNEHRKYDDAEGHPFQGHSHVPAYFFRKHGIKIFDKYPKERSKINFENTYKPEPDSNTERTCPSCEQHNIDVKGGEAECEDCGYKNTEVWFSQYSLDVARTHDTSLTRKKPEKDKEPHQDQNPGRLDKLLQMIKQIIRT